MESRRTKHPRNQPLRYELETFVVACNKYLKKVVGTMDNVILLRNMHPIYRLDFARKLKEVDMITGVQLKEFIVLK